MRVKHLTLLGLVNLLFVVLVIRAFWRSDLSTEIRQASNKSPNLDPDAITPNEKIEYMPVNSKELNPRSRNIFYNRVAKCGSRSLLEVVGKLSQLNQFNVSASSEYSDEHSEFEDPSKEVHRISQLKPPTFYNRHVHFIDFAKYGYEKPIYINIIRNPIDRFVSQYNYHKYGDNDNSMNELEPNRVDINECVKREMVDCNSTMITFYIGMYFCGLHPTCLVRSRERVSLAKKHLDEEYTFVGMMEEFETTLLLLEKLLPEYFAGALQVWQQNKASKTGTKTKKGDVLTQESIYKLQAKTLVSEFEVYNFAKEKFDRLKKKFGLE